MNSFSPPSGLLDQSFDANLGKVADDQNNNGNSVGADFDFGDLVTMTIIDVFETDSDGKLLSYCPTFDNRAVHKTQEVTERIRKGASNLMEKMVVVKKSPAGKGVNRAAKMAISVGSLVRHKIEEEIQKHQQSPPVNRAADIEDIEGSNRGPREDIDSKTAATLSTR